jgi:hypothetical protein
MEWKRHDRGCRVGLGRGLAAEPGAKRKTLRQFVASLAEKGRPGLTVTLIAGELSLRTSLTAQLDVIDCLVPGSALLPGSGGLRSPLSCINHARYGIAWGVIGAAMARYDEARQDAMCRVQSCRSIASFNGVIVQSKLGGGEAPGHAHSQKNVFPICCAAEKRAQIALCRKRRHLRLSLVL